MLHCVTIWDQGRLQVMCGMANALCVQTENGELLKSVKGEGNNLLKETREILTGGLREKKEYGRGEKSPSGAWEQISTMSYGISSSGFSKQESNICSWEVRSGLPLNKPRDNHHYQELIHEGMRGKHQLWTDQSNWECWLFCLTEKKTCGLLDSTDLTTWLHALQGCCFQIASWNWQTQILPFISEQFTLLF